MHSGQFTVVLDACVLYPAPVRDILLSLASKYLFRPIWTDEINNEWKRNLLIKRDDLKESTLKKTIDDMNLAFPDANISDYEAFISSITLPDKDDRHVVAAAIRGRADVIVTYNLKDFPNTDLKKFGISAKHPDEFLVNVIDLDNKEAIDGFREMVSRLKNPPLQADDVLDKWLNIDLKRSSEKIRSLL